MALGFLADSNFEERVIENAAVTAARFIQGFLEPLVQSMASGPSLNQEETSSLDKLLFNPVFRSNVVNLKIWHPDGTIVYSDEKNLKGLKLGLHDELRGAFGDKVTTEQSEPHAHKDHSSFALDFPVPIVEVHAPLHLAGGKKVIAAAEFVMDADVLSKDLRDARRSSLKFAGFFGFLALILAATAVCEFRKLRRQPWHAVSRTRETFLRKAQASENARSGSASGKSMREIMSDLHDGPAQLLALACLKLDEMGRCSSGSLPREQIDAVRGVTGDALNEIRGIMQMSRGPKIEQMSLEEALTFAANMHALRTRSAVALNIAPLPAVSDEVKNCLVQFVREGLSNAFWHADGQGQAVSAHRAGDILVVEVSDSGSDFQKKPGKAGGGGFGLDAMQERIKFYGGSFELFPSCGSGTRLVVRFAVEAQSPIAGSTFSGPAIDQEAGDRAHLTI